MARDDIEFGIMPMSQTPEYATPGTDGERNSDGGYFAAADTRLPNEGDFIQRQEFSLPPVDGGKDAWLFLAAVFVVDALVWGTMPPAFSSGLSWERKYAKFLGFIGFPFAFGVFQNYYNSHEPFAGQPSIVVIGTSSMGVIHGPLPDVWALDAMDSPFGPRNHVPSISVELIRDDYYASNFITRCPLWPGWWDYLLSLYCVLGRMVRQ
ncbi:hypothetical protein O1611_g10375 [Lasiodiplodia mahajangana]|uniref:Uncharacterized protein n=1 Tax=Lasiodiplodia mahajangana TaxID=1108764 RepID=A0ACC2IYW2_9PEZI|nr:hypothetical protein O1611_g10375 [Lasiodiplodia mahajangana]